MVFQYLIFKCISLQLTPQASGRTSIPYRHWGLFLLLSLFCLFVWVFLWCCCPLPLQDPSALIPHAFSRLSLTGIKGRPSDWRRVSLGPSNEGGGSLKQGLCGFPRMKGAQKTLCEHHSQTARWPWGPSAFCICAFQRCLVMSSPDRDALLHSRILSPGRLFPTVSLGADFLTAIHSQASPRPHEFLGSHLK